MKHLAVTLGMLTLAVPMMAVAQASTWTPDKAHSEVDFSILHMSLSKVHGRFGIGSGQIQWNEADVTKSTVNVTIDVSTIDTGVSGRDADLKSAGMFDVAQFPTATFTSTSVAKTANGLTVNGNLTLHGVTKPSFSRLRVRWDRFQGWITSPTPGSPRQPRSAAPRSASEQSTPQQCLAMTSH